MGRGKIEIKRIENPTSRQVTFSKRRGGLLKKAHELAVLCDAEVALIIFSSTGKLFEFASSGSMQAILERYSRSSEGAQQPGNNSEFMGREVVRLRQQLDHLENSQRHMLGENLSVLTVPDLLLLEQQLDMGVSRIRAKKNQLLLEEIDNLRRKERDLQQVNEELRQKALELQQVNEEQRQKALELQQEHELADASGMAEAVARALPLVGQGQITTLASHEPGGSSQTPRVYPTHPNLQDPQTSQTSLHLGLFSETFPRRSSGQMSEHSQVGAEGRSIGLHTSQWM
ncbi:unnamed protein product [Sphagnum jensenii]|uniref:MADS-box transcription factor n=1 Tax=Sphagnum jensenii TaxID=128206 RepID=A0ABP1BQ94_9BRYO